MCLDPQFNIIIKFTLIADRDDLRIRKSQYEKKQLLTQPGMHKGAMRSISITAVSNSESCFM